MLAMDTDAIRALKDWGITAEAFEIGGSEYVVTTGTGEVSYGRDGGTACFAYDADAVAIFVARFSDGGEEAGRRPRYSEDFCAWLDPIADARDVAIWLAAREEYRLTEGGACTPVLSDADYALVRAAVEVAS